MPRSTDDANKLIRFEKNNNTYLPQLRPGGLNEEILNTGNLTVLRSFLENNRNTLTNDELEYLRIRISAQEAFEQQKKKSAEALMTDNDNKLPDIDNKNGFVGFSGFSYPGKQSSLNGCWSCALSLMLATRGVQLTQEQIRGWRPEYQPNNGISPANKDSTYKRNGDTSVAIEDNADMITQLLPNTALETLTIPPFMEGTISLSDPNRPGVDIRPDRDRLALIKNLYMAQVRRALKDNLAYAINTEHSPVALLVDGHYVTVTGISPDGRLRVQDSNAEPTEQITTIDKILNDGMERHQKLTHQNQLVTIEPNGIALAYLKKIPVKKNQADPTKIDADTGKDKNIVSFDGEGNVKVDMTGTQDVVQVGTKAQGVLTSKGISKSIKLDDTPIRQQLGGLIVGNFGAPGAVIMHNDTFYPSKLVKPGVIVREQQMQEQQPQAQQRPKRTEPARTRPAAEVQIIDRVKLLKRIKEIKEGLVNTRAMAGGASEIMQKLRESVDRMIVSLEDPEDKITDEGIRIKLETLKTYSRFYMSEKKHGGISRLRTDDTLPKTKMGTERYLSALSLATFDLSEYMISPSRARKKSILKDFVIVDKYYDIQKTQRETVWGVVYELNSMPDNAVIDDFKGTAARAIAEMLVMPKLYDQGVEPDPTKLITEGEYAGSTKADAFESMVQRVQHRADFTEMINGVKNVSQLKKLCMTALCPRPEKAIAMQLQKTKAHKNEVKAEKQIREQLKTMARNDLNKN